MKILEVATNIWYKITIDEVQPSEIKKLTAKRYFFDWKKEAAQNNPIYKLRLAGNDDIKGLVSCADFPNENRTQIILLSASKENVILEGHKEGKQKEFEGIIGNLIAFVGELAIVKFGKNASVSLIPKTVLKQHYIKKYGMFDAGTQVYLLYDQLKNLIAKYKI